MVLIFYALLGINLANKDFQPRKQQESLDTPTSSTSNSSSSGCSTSSMFELGSSDIFTTPESSYPPSSSDESDVRPSKVYITSRFSLIIIDFSAKK